MKKYLIIILLILATVYSCKEEDKIVAPTSLGKLNYQSFDTTGVLIVDGWMTVELKDSMAIIGSWQLNNLQHRDDIGPQEGAGELIGYIEGSSVTIDLNPGNADHNVYLNGTLTGNGIQGQWVWTSFIGPTNWGTFKAVKD
jgi:hypothetical protein